MMATERAELTAPLPADPGMAWDEASRRIRPLLGRRYWMRTQRNALNFPTYQIGVKGPDGRFELRAEGSTWAAALEALARRLWGAT